MNAREASQKAACIEFDLGAGADRARVECFAVPCRKGSSRRKSRWVFLVVTDLSPREIRDALPGFQVETLSRRGSRTTHAAWPAP